MTQARSRFLAIAVATTAAVATLSGCSAQATPESVALSFSEAFMMDNGKPPSEFMCEGAPKGEADGARWTTDLASDLKIGEKSEVDSDGYQKIEVTYVRSGSPGDMVVKVDTRDLCVTDAGAHLTIDSSSSSSEATEEPEPTATPEAEPERVEFATSSITFADLAEVAERGDIPVILLPASLDAAVILVGAPEEWSTASFLRVFSNGDGSITIKPQAKYDALADPQDYVGESSGTVTFHGATDIVVEIEGVDP